VENDEALLPETLDSIIPLQPDIVIGNLTNKTLDICRNYKINILRIKFKSRAEACNKLIETTEGNWFFYLQPGEVLIQGYDEIREVISNNETKTYSINILQSDIITKQPRLWNKSQNLYFKNPVFEKLVCNNSSYLDVILYSNLQRNDLKTSRIIEDWEKANPFDAEPYYYKAFIKLREKKFEEFKLLANRYLFKNTNNNTMALSMIRYYLAIIEWFNYKNFRKSIENLIHCLTVNPLMAEYWCLLGDIHVDCNEFEKAISFYENAIILGSHRLREDQWPMQITKYKEYPEEMKQKCKKLLENKSNYNPIR